LFIGPRVGYKFVIYKGLYVSTWGALWKNVFKEETFKVNNDDVSTKSWDYILTFHIGYHFKYK